jgi:hypothetical protein
MYGKYVTGWLFRLNGHLVELKQFLQSAIRALYSNLKVEQPYNLGM